MMEELFSEIDVSIDHVKKKFYGVTAGRVINVLDPLMLGRVQVQLPFIDSLDLSPWARVATLMAGPTVGSYFLPNMGDEVLIAFEQGDVNVPYVIGSLWNAMSPPPLPSPLPQVRLLKTLAQNQIMITDIPPTITINTPTAVINLSPAGVTIATGTSLVNVTPAGVAITADAIAVSGLKTVAITAPTVSITGTSAVNIQSAGACNITAPVVKIN